MGKYFSLLRKAVKGLEKKNNAIYLLGSKEIYSLKHKKKLTLYSLFVQANSQDDDDKNRSKAIHIYSCVSEVDMLKKVAELLKEEGKGGGGSGG